jgi:hypothetical protein
VSFSFYRYRELMDLFTLCLARSRWYGGGNMAVASGLSRSSGDADAVARPDAAGG